MKLKTGFALLTTGVLVIPIISITLYFSAQSLFAPEPEFIRFVRTSSAAGQKPLSGQEGSLPPYVSDLVVLGEGGKILSSTLPGLAGGSSASLFEVVRLLRINHPKPMFFIQPIQDQGVESVRIAVADSGHKPPRPEAVVSRLAVILLLPLLVFTAVFATLFIRRLKKSIGDLEAATARISAGDLGSSALISGTDELAGLSRSLDSMRASLQDEFARRARFVMGVSHDLRTPLANIRGYAEAIHDGLAETEEQRSHYSAIIIDKAELLKARIDELIEFTRMERGEWKLTNKNTRLAAFLKGIVARMGEDVRLLGKRFDSSIDVPEDFCVEMDGSQVERVFENLVGNAQRYSDEGGLIAIRAAVQGGKVTVEIENDGPGIPEQELGYIFDPFYRGSRSRRGSGFGLGLSVARLILEEHGWSVGFSSKPGKTVCTIVIPSSPVPAMK